MGWLIALGIIAALCALILFLPIRAIIQFVKKSDKTGFDLIVKIGFFKIKIPNDKKEKDKKPKKKEEKTEAEKEDEKQPMGEKIKKGIALYKLIADDAKAILSYTARNAFRFELIDLNLYYGTEDAATTGMLYGVISGIIHGLIGTVSNLAKVDKRKIIITPDFAKSAFEAEGKCIVKLRNVHIIVIAYKIVKLLLKIRKESD